MAGAMKGRHVVAGALLALPCACGGGSDASGTLAPGAFQVAASDASSPSNDDSGPRAIDPAAWVASDKSLLFWLSGDDAKTHLDPSGVVQTIDNAAASAPALTLHVPDGGVGPTRAPSGIAGRPALHFDSSKMTTLVMDGGFDTLTDAFTIALALRPSEGSAPGRIVSFGAGSDDQEGGLNWNDVFRAVHASSADDYAYVDSPATVSEPAVIVLSFGTLAQAPTVYVNGARDAAAPTVVGTAETLAYVARNLIFSPVDSLADFDLGEALLFKRELASDDAAIVSRYLGTRWGVSVQSDAGDAGSGASATFTTVEAILHAHGCEGCHVSGSTAGAGVDLSTFDALSPLVVAGAPLQSRLYGALDPMGMMPGASPLSALERQTVFDWIAQGAKD
jgi:hypothetical protein